MNRFLRSRLCRCCVCLILVLVLLISWSPIRAQASALPEVAGVATKVIPFAQAVEPAALGVGGTIFCWVVAALGVVFTAYQAVQAYNHYQDFTGELETAVYYYPDGSWSYGVDMDFVERVRAFLFDTGYVVSLAPSRDFDAHDFPAGSRWPAINDSVISAGESAVFYKVDNGTSVTCLLYHCEKGVLSISIPTGTYYNIKCSCGRFYATRGADTGNNIETITSYESNLNIANATFWHISGDIDVNIGVSPGDGIEIAEVPAPHVDLPVGYPEWHTNARPATNPDTQEEITVLPIPLNPSADPETQIGTLTQPNIWQGTIADPMPDMQPDPNPNPGTNPDPGTNPGTGVPSDIGDYQIDLKKFFPFCIPFDLYDLFSCLAADPVAPVIEWVIPLPGGDTYPLEIDLSAFDGVAQLLRRMQLLLFCVGLAFKTRDLIKG